MAGGRKREICGLRSEGHEMNRARGPSGVCPGDMCDWVRERRGLVAGEVHRTSSRKREETDMDH